MALRTTLVLVITVAFGSDHVLGQWQPVLPDEDVWGLDVKGDTLVVGTYDGHLLFSGDGGSTWEERTGNMPNGYIENVIITEDGKLVCSNGSGVWSSDDWSTWTLRHSIGNSITCLVVSANTVLAGGEFNGGLSASFDGGDTWSSLTTGQVQQYTTTAALSGDSILWGRFGAEAVFTDDDGSTWSPLSGLGINVFSFSEDGDFAGNEGFLFRRSGSDWVDSYVNAQVLDIETSPDHVAASGFCNSETQYVFLSADEGITWSWIEATFSGFQISKVALTDRYLYAGGSDGLHRLDLGVWAGIEKLTAYRDFQLLPNPANDHVTIRCGDDAPLIRGIRVVDASGRTVFQQPAQGGPMVLDVTPLVPGTYSVLVGHAAGLSSLPLIIMR